MSSVLFVPQGWKQFHLLIVIHTGLVIIAWLSGTVVSRLIHRRRQPLVGEGHVPLPWAAKFFHFYHWSDQKLELSTPRSWNLKNDSEPSLHPGTLLWKNSCLRSWRDERCLDRWTQHCCSKCSPPVTYHRHKRAGVFTHGRTVRHSQRLTSLKSNRIHNSINATSQDCSVDGPAARRLRKPRGRRHYCNKISKSSLLLTIIKILIHIVLYKLCA